MPHHAIHAHHDPILMGLSILVAVLASFTALDIAGQIAATTGWRRAGWLACAATALGGGIWSMHFIGMLALNVSIPITYEPFLTAASLVIAVGFVGLGLSLTTWLGARRAVIGGAGTVTGLGVAAMHYTGMAAMSMDATTSYDSGLVTLSVMIAVVAATTALWLAFNQRGLGWKIAASGVMGAAIAGMHYTGMAALTLVRLPMVVGLRSSIDGDLLGATVAIVTIGILGFGVLAVRIERRFAAFSEREALALQASERRFRSLVQNSFDLIVVIDSGHRITYASPSAVAVLGIEPDTLVDLCLTDLVDPQDRRDVDLTLDMLARDGAAALEWRLVRSDGDRRLFDVSARDLLGDSAVRGMVLTLRDITYERRTAEELTAAKELAELANRSKSEFLANMSHELRTPLNAIIGFSEIIRDQALGPVGTAEYADYAGDINRSGARLLEVINDILDIAKIEAGQVELSEEDIDLGFSIKACCWLMRDRAREGGVEISMTIPEGFPRLLADERKLKQALVNLLSNAVKFTPEGGEVEIRASLEEDGGCRIEVIDTGIGIAPESIDRVAAPFVQADTSLGRKYEGAGLGLAIAKSLTRLHDGTLKIDSTLGKGTVVTLLFPPERVGRPRERKIALAG